MPANFYSRISSCFLLFMLLGFQNAMSQAFITRWNSAISGNTRQIVVPATGSYHIDWHEVITPSNSGSLDVSGEAIVTFPTPGIYELRITGGLTSIAFQYNPAKSSMEILSIEQWGNIVWTTMESAFEGCENMEVNATDAPNLSAMTNAKRMFMNCKAINSNINGWDVSSITDMTNLFYGVDINQSLNAWDVSNVISMNGMFGNSTFNSDISSWNVSNVTDMYGMFILTPFNQPIGNWDVSKVIDMNYMFGLSDFNQDIAAWNVSSVEDMTHMFAYNFVFNQPIGNWNVSKVRHIQFMFENATAFNQNLSGWNVTSVQYFHYAFLNATSFNQSLASWQVSQVVSMASMLDNTALSVANYDATLIAWFNQGLPDNIPLGAIGLKYCAALSQHNTLVASKGWTITGDGLDCPLKFENREEKNGETISETTQTCYPNPWNTSLHETLHMDGISGETVQATLTDAMGRIVYSETLQPMNNRIEIAANVLRDYSRGVYVLKVISAKEIYTSTVTLW